MAKYNKWIDAMSFPYRKRYYLTHPLDFFKQLKKNIKFAKDRVKYGFCKSDCWEIYSWLLETLPQMLETLKEEGIGVSYQFKESPDEPWEKTSERQDKYYEEMIQHFYNAKEDCDKAEQKNEWKIQYEKTLESFEGRDCDTYSTVAKKYWDRENELSDWRQKEIEQAFKMLAKVFYSLWD